MKKSKRHNGKLKNRCTRKDFLNTEYCHKHCNLVTRCINCC